VYLADHPMSAIVETVVHLDIDSEDTPAVYTLLKISIPDGIAVETLEPPAADNWKQEIGLTQRIGDAWLKSLKTPLARVPSVIAPQTWNYLLNPQHPEAKQVQVAEMIREQFDNRLFRFGAR